MTQKTEGYIELEWTCPNCQGNNPGPVKTCLNCGAPQPAEVAFHLPGEAKLKTDQATARQADAGPDLHCPYCGARNAGGTGVKTSMPFLHAMGVLVGGSGLFLHPTPH